MIELGIRVKDVVTGFEGVVIGRTEWLTGCRTYGLQGEMRDGEVPEARWIDEVRLDLISDSTLRLPGVSSGPVEVASLKGGPQPTPSRDLAPK